MILFKFQSGDHKNEKSLGIWLVSFFGIHQRQIGKAGQFADLHCTPVGEKLYLWGWLKTFFELRNILRLQKPFLKKCVCGGGGGHIPHSHPGSYSIAVDFEMVFKCSYSLWTLATATHSHDCNVVVALIKINK